MTNKIKIDEIDAKILKRLLSESRTSFTDLAKECKITVAAVRMRYKHLWNEGVINGEKMLVNPHCLGYRHIVDLGVTCAVEDEQEVATFLENKPYISELVGPMGRYNFLGKVALKDLNKLHEIIEEFESNHKVKHVDAMIWSEAINLEYPQNLVIKPLDRENDPPNGQKPACNLGEIEFDETDKKIAKILSENSRTPFKTIAAQLNISAKTVIQRYRKLRENLLPLSTITVDLNKLGYRALANIYIKLSNRSKMAETYSQLLAIPNLIVIIRLIDSYDLYCALAVEDFENIFEAEHQIRRISGVENTTVYLSKPPFAWPLNLFPSLIDNEAVMPKYWTR